MQEAVSARTPVHLWIVGIVSLLWSCFGCFDYLMSNLHNQAYLAQMPDGAVAYMDSLPAWNTGTWALGVWGGLAGSILLLMRSRYSVWAFAVSALGAVVGLGYQIFMTEMPASMTAGGMAVIPWVIIIITLFLLWYSWTMEKKGLLR